MTEDSDRPVTRGEMREAFVAFAAVIGGIGMYQSLAIIGSLAEAKIVAPAAVAKWADFFAANLPADQAAQGLGISEGVENFSRLLLTMATKPEGAGRA